jgi:hypothetical protein
MNEKFADVYSQLLALRTRAADNGLEFCNFGLQVAVYQQYCRVAHNPTLETALAYVLEKEGAAAGEKIDSRAPIVDCCVRYVCPNTDDEAVEDIVNSFEQARYFLAERNAAAIANSLQTS